MDYDTMGPIHHRTQKNKPHNHVSWGRFMVILQVFMVALCLSGSPCASWTHFVSLWSFCLAVHLPVIILSLILVVLSFSLGYWPVARWQREVREKTTQKAAYFAKILSKQREQRGFFSRIPGLMLMCNVLSNYYHEQYKILQILHFLKSVFFLNLWASFTGALYQNCV